MRIAVTGGFGYVGAHLVARLRAAGHEVVVLSLLPPAEDLPARVADVEWVAADVSAPATYTGALDGCDALVHAAAMGAGPATADPAGAFRVNGYGTRAVLDAAVEAGVRRAVYFSTYHVYGKETGTITEKTPTRPVSDYGITKLAGEGAFYRAARRGDIEPFILRFSNGFGAPLSREADCWSLAFPNFARSAAETGRIRLLSAGMQQRDFLTVGDMCAAVEIALDAAAPRTGDTDIAYNVGGGASLSMREAASIVADAYGEIRGEPAAIDLPEGTADAPAEPGVDYRFERIAKLGYAPSGDLAAEALATLKYLRVRPKR